MQRQLSIFDTLQPPDTALARIRSGDWVKLRKDAAGAIDWSTGEVLQVESIDPASGRARFWNDRVQGWGYLRSGDMALTVPPLKVLKNPPIAPVEESTPVPDVAESPAESVVAESNPAPGEIDSATTPPIALVAESSTPPAALVAESPTPPAEIDSATRAVSTYKPKGTARGGEYFRFVYRAGTKTKSVHIPGGNTGNILAQSRAAEVMELVAAGVPAVEICDRIRSWSGRITW
jgi:hypothetical protein